MTGVQTCALPIYSKIRQPKLSDVIEQQLEFLILEGTLRPGEKLPPERELAKQFDVSRPSLREAIQRLEAKGLLLRRQGGGTFVQSSLWQSFSDPLVELLSDHPESQYDLLETRHALEGIAAYYAALRSTDEDKERIRELHHAIELAQQSGDLDAESNAVLQYQIAVTEAAHNVVLLHLLRCMEPMLAQNVRQNFELLYSRREMLPLVSSHRTRPGWRYGCARSSHPSAPAVHQTGVLQWSALLPEYSGWHRSPAWQSQ